MKNYFCPKCKTNLILGKKEKYETLIEHVSPNDNSIEERDTYICPNENCDFYNTVFWDMLGDFYTDHHFLYQNNKIDVNNRSTFKNCGIYAGGSYMYDNEQETIKKRNNFLWSIKHEISGWYRRKIESKFSSLSIHLRRQHNPKYCLYRDKQSKIKFVFAQFIGHINPFKTARIKWWNDRNDFDVIFDNYSYHPYPWFRYYARYFLKKNGYEYRWNNIIEEQTKMRWI